IAKNSAKKTLFSEEERIEIIKECCSGIEGNIEIVSFEGLLVDYCKNKGISFIIRGLRSVTDFEYESPIASINRKLAPDVETVLLMTREDTAFISSKIVKEIAGYKGDIAALVPQFVAEKIQQKYQ
ncbi:MAG: pantetheine-phosphate adenylyltransferase, partial [bacterium]|nr:pantetheine-phosphate adenylyltransferase [bacterium]